MTHILLSVGSNIDRDKNIRFAIDEIKSKFGELESSPVYETDAVGFDGPRFFNLVIAIHSELALLEVRAHLHHIESSAGRVLGKKSFDNRILDIDMLLFGDENLQSQGFNIPRDGIEKYAYVLKPLSDLYPHMRHPLSGETYIEMWEKFNKEAQSLWLADFKG